MKQVLGNNLKIDAVAERMPRYIRLLKRSSKTFTNSQINCKWMLKSPYFIHIHSLLLTYIKKFYNHLVFKRYHSKKYYIYLITLKLKNGKAIEKLCFYIKPRLPLLLKVKTRHSHLFLKFTTITTPRYFLPPFY